MKAGIHPDYRQVIFHDTSVNHYFKIGSTMSSTETIEWEDGNTYPLVQLDISSASHPFYTGKQREDSRGETGGRQAARSRHRRPRRTVQAPVRQHRNAPPELSRALTQRQRASRVIGWLASFECHISRTRKHQGPR